MSFVWAVDCKTCQQRFGVRPREIGGGMATNTLPKHLGAGEFECPHCHDVHEYRTDDFIPSEGRVATS